MFAIPEATDGLTAWTLQYPVRPWTTNRERKESPFWRAERVKEFREAFGWLALQARIPPLVDVRIYAQPTQKGGTLADTAACNPAAKAAIDGLVDARVMPDDSPEHLGLIAFLPTTKGIDALQITVHGRPAVTTGERKQ